LIANCRQVGIKLAQEIGDKSSTMLNNYIRINNKFMFC